jgi:uncharacterized protein YkwD
MAVPCEHPFVLSPKSLFLSTLVVPCVSACFLVDPSDESGPDPQVEPGGDEPADMAGTTEAHNAARAGVQPAAEPAIPPLSWSSDLAGVALSHATKCVFDHSENSFGENLYAAVGSTPTPAEVVSSWVSEVADYDYSSNSCSPGAVCGHYTQVVWRNTATVGCAAVTCTANSPFGGSDPWINWVCNYDPPGNFVGEKPY